MSKKISEMGPKASMVDADEFTILDSADPTPETKNKRVLKTVALAGLATQASVDAVQTNLDTHAAGSVAVSHPDGATQNDLNNHKTAANQHPISGVTGLQTALDAKANTADLGDSATRDVGVTAGDVAQGDAPAGAVTGHESSFDHTNIPTTAQKAALDGNPALGGGNVIPGRSELPSADQQAAMDAADSPTGLNPFRVQSDQHASFSDLATSGHPGSIIVIGGGTQGNAVVIAADGSLEDGGTPPGGGSGLHADLTDLSTSGHPGTVITIGGGVQGNAVSIAADGSLQDSGVPPGGAGGTTDLGNNPTATNVEITSSSGQNTTVAGATNAVAGVATAAHITQLESAVQPDDPLTDLSSGAATNGQVPHADGAGNIAWQTPASGGWVDGTTIADWGLTPQNLGTIGGSTTIVDLDNGHHITATLNADHTINFTSTGNHPVTQWTATIATAGHTPTFQFGGVAVDLPKDYDLSGSPPRINFSFIKDTFGVSVSERQMQ